MVNADFLAFLCMEWAIEQERIEIVEVEPLVEQSIMVQLPLWRFMRHHLPKIGQVQAATAKRWVIFLPPCSLAQNVVLTC